MTDPLDKPLPEDDNEFSQDDELLDDPFTTLDLLSRARGGDRTALDVLMERCLPPLRRWTHGRLPPAARGALDTSDLVQEAVLHALGRIELFESRHVGALQSYLREAVRNRICDEIRRVQRRGVPMPLPDDQRDAGPSPLEEAIAREDVARYQAAMKRLRPADRDVIEARLEWGHSFEDVAVAMGKPSAAAARMSFSRALEKLAVELECPVPGPGPESGAST